MDEMDQETPEVFQGMPPDQGATSKPDQGAPSKYRIYDDNVAGTVHSIQTAAQFGDRRYIINVLEKALDADVNAMVSECRLLLKIFLPPCSRLPRERYTCAG